MGGRETREGEGTCLCEASTRGAVEGEGGRDEDSPGETGFICEGGYGQA